MEISFTLPLPISINSLYQNQGRYNKAYGRYELTGQRIMSKEGTALKKEMTRLAEEAVKQQKWDIDELADYHVYMDVEVFFNRRGRDADNLLKMMQDSMQGVIYNNDSQVLPRFQKVVYDKINPRVEISFTRVNYVGIFNNLESAEEFEDNCMTCSRYLNGRCSILKDSLNGTVREEISNIDESVCSKYKEKKK